MQGKARNQHPIRQWLPVQRHPMAFLDCINKQVQELVVTDFVEPAASPQTSEVVLVGKRMAPTGCLSTIG